MLFEGKYFLRIKENNFVDMLIFLFLHDHQINKKWNWWLLNNNLYYFLDIQYNLYNKNLTLVYMNIPTLIFLLKYILINLYHFSFLDMMIKLFDLRNLGFLFMNIFLFFNFKNFDLEKFWIFVFTFLRRIPLLLWI
jgi:hypothetical protein